LNSSLRLTVTFLFQLLVGLMALFGLLSAAPAPAPAPAPLTNIRAPGALAAAILAGEGLIAKGNNSREKREQQQ
jgi:hypothetical protein